MFDGGGGSSSSSSDEFNTVAKVLTAASKSGDMSDYGSSRFTTQIGNTEGSLVVTKLLGNGEDDNTNVIFRVLGELAQADQISSAAFDTPVEPNFTDSTGIQVSKFQINRASFGFYILATGPAESGTYKFVLKCRTNDSGAFDTELYSPSKYIDCVSYTSTGTSKTRFLYQRKASEQSNVAYVQSTASASGIQGFRQCTKDSKTEKASFVSNRTYTGVYAQQDDGNYSLILLDASGTVLASKSDANASSWDSGSSNTEVAENLTAQAQTLFSSFPTFSPPSFASDLKTMCDNWN